MTPLHDFLVGDTRRPLLVLLGAVALLMLIACANVGNLLLVQAAGREREMALRLALGAGRFRLVRQALTESLLLSLTGGVAGLLLGWWGTHALMQLQPAGMLPMSDVHVSWQVTAYVAAIAVASGALFGIAPALWNGARAPSDALKEGGRGDLGGRRLRRWGNSLVVFEVALALVLTLGAGLLARSFWNLQSVNPGFESNGVMTLTVALPGARYDSSAKISAFFDELVTRAHAIRGVESAAVVSALPASGYAYSSDFAVEGSTGPGVISQVVHREISPAYPAVMRVPLIRGRLFTEADRAGSVRVTLINEALAKKFFPGQDPLGKRVTFDRVPDAKSTWRTIVGVVGSERQGGLAEESKPEFLVAFDQEVVNSSMTLVVRAGNDPAALAPELRRAVASLDKNLAITDLRTMNDVRAESVSRARFLTTLLLVFAVVGLTLSVVGVYGVVAQLVRARIREMGIRVALGAPVGNVQWLIVRHGLVLAAAGVAVGLACAFAGTRAMTSLLYQVDPVDPPTFIGVALVLTAAVLAATWIPARRAARVDPMETLRGE